MNSVYIFTGMYGFNSLGDFFILTVFFFQCFSQFSHKTFQVDTCDTLENHTISLTTSFVFDSHLKLFGGADMGNLTDGNK